MKDNSNTAVRKRQQIENTNRVMFIWVATAAAIIGIALVVSFSLFQRLMFNQKVINEKNQTVANLQHNNEIVDELRQNSRVLNTNGALLETPRPEGAEPISVVLDALPAQANSSALGASLQKKLLTKVTIDSLTVNPVAAEEGDRESSSGTKEVDFSFTVSSNNVNDIKAVLRNLELSIRTINVQSLSIEQRSRAISLSVKGVAYYSPEVKVEFEDKRIKP